MPLTKKLFNNLIEFTRGSVGTYYDFTGTLKTAPAGSPRFDYDPVTFAPRGLLVEEQRTNLLLQSETFDNAYWALLNATVTANAAVAPSGATSADKLVETAATGDHRILNNLGETVTSGATYTWSVFAKAGERSSVRVVNNNISGATFDLNTGAASNVSGGITAASFNFGNGWYRLSISGNAVTTTERIGVYLVSGGNTNYTGNGTSGAFIWGAQLEAGAFATSYIPTTTAAVTRNADLAKVVGANFSGIYNPLAGTLLAEATILYGAGTTAIDCAASIDDNTANNRLQIRRTSSTQLPTATVVTAGTTTFPSTSATGATAVGANGIFRIALGYEPYDTIFGDRGLLSTVDSNVALPVVTQLQIGNGTSVQPLNGHIRKIMYFQNRLTDAQLKMITAI